MTRWLLEKDVFLESFIERLVTALQTQRRDFWWVEYAPFGASMSRPRHYSNPSMFIEPDDCVVVYGSINLVRRLLERNPWAKNAWQPTAWMTLKNLECVSYYTHWRKHMLVRQNAFVTWKMLNDDKEFYYDRFSVDDCIFVKPNANLKLFSGKVVPIDDFEHFYRQETDCYDVHTDALCVIAKPYRLSHEWRFMVCDGKVITGSLYRENGESSLSPNVDPLALAVAEKVAQDPWQPDPAYVVDVAQSGDEYGLLEIGSANCAGMYECDASLFANALSALAEQEYSETKD
jgi:hypothetical protein